MSELSLVLSEKFAEDDAISIRTALSQHFEVGYCILDTDA